MFSETVLAPDGFAQDHVKLDHLVLLGLIPIGIRFAPASTSKQEKPSRRSESSQYQYFTETTLWMYVSMGRGGEG